MTKNIQFPLISCLCVTRGKPKLLERAISCFNYQTYSNKELIVVYEDDDLLTRGFVNSIKNPKIFVHEVRNSKKVTLGYLRNYAVENSHGEYICQWDDDDWYNIHRIETQYKELYASNLPSCVLSQWLVFNSNTQKAYYSNERFWEGSLLCLKSIFKNIKYPHLKRGEDTPVIEYLNKSKKLKAITHSANLYIYVYHGKNTFDFNHWDEIFKGSDELDSKLSNKIHKMLNSKDIRKSSMALDKLHESFFFGI